MGWVMGYVLLEALWLLRMDIGDLYKEHTFELHSFKTELLGTRLCPN